MKKKAMEQALKRQREIADAAKAENRDLTDAEQREFDNLTAMIDLLTADNTPEGGERQTNPPAAPANPPAAPTNPPAENPNNAERTLSPEDVIAITEMCRHYNVDAADMFRRNLSVDDVRKEIMDRQMNENQPVASRITAGGDSGEDKRRRDIVDGMILKGGGTVENPSQGANAYRAFSIRDIAIECLERDNPNGADYRHMNIDDMFRAASRSFYNPESSFPAILDEVVQKSYVEGLTLAGTQFERFVKFGSLPNFKKSSNHEYLVSYSGELEEVPENGELKNYIPEDVLLPLRELKTYGRQFTMTRKAFIDDDIGMLTTMPRRFARLSQTTQNKIVYNILLNKQKIFDGKYLFDNSRKNTLATGSIPARDVIQKMIYMIGIQKDAAGNQLAIKPNIFIVPLGLGAAVEELILTPVIYSAEGTITNPLYGKGFEVIEDVTLNGMVKEGESIPWFMAVKGEFIQIDYLNGQSAATIRRSEEAGKLGFVWDVYHDFGVSALHPEAICRNPGVAFDAEGVVKS